MQTSDECLNQAMFLASESYSGSSYDLGAFQLMGSMCDEIFVLAPKDGGGSISALAS